MAKDYITLLVEWCCLKINLALNRNSIVFNQGDIWWCSIGINIGEEIYGKGSKYRRPVFVLKKLTSNSFLGLPLTSQDKNGSWYIKIVIEGKTSRIMLNQARVLDKRRLTSRIATVNGSDFSKIKARFLEFYS